MTNSHNACSAATEQDYLEDNIATVAHHLGQPGAFLCVRYDGDAKLLVDPGEVLKEVSRRLTRAANGGERLDPIRWIKDTYLMWLKGDLEPAHMRRGQEFFDKRIPDGAQPTRDQIYAIVLRELETKHPIPTTVLLATRIANALAARPPAAPVETARDEIEVRDGLTDGYCDIINKTKRTTIGRLQLWNGTAQDVRDILAARPQCSAGNAVEDVARTICLSYGRDPDELTSILEMCTADNKPVPAWRVYEEQAEAVVAKHLTASEPQSSTLPVEAIRAAVSLLARKITKLSWSRDDCRRKGQDVYVANLTAQIDQLDGYYSALSALALSRPHLSREGK